MKIAIIPARGGSKRLPGKNIKEFCGKPIIAFSIEAALKANVFNKVIVSTDDIEIADIAKKYGADVPFLRPANISDDYSTTLDVMKHSVEWCMKNISSEIEQFCCLYATAPFIEARHLVESSMLLKGNIKYIFSAAEFSYNIFRSFKLTKNNRVKMFWPENFTKRSQDLETAYHDAGMFYFGTTKAFINKDLIFKEHSKPYLLPHYLVQDIDTKEDWKRAELMYKLNNELNAK